MLNLKLYTTKPLTDELMDEYSGIHADLPGSCREARIDAFAEELEDAGYDFLLTDEDEVGEGELVEPERAMFYAIYFEHNEVRANSGAYGRRAFHREVFRLFFDQDEPREVGLTQQDIDNGSDAFFDAVEGALAADQNWQDFTWEAVDLDEEIYEEALYA